jgi:tellurite resistance protein TehA-like permease
MLKVGTILLAIGLIFSSVYGILLVFTPATISASTLEVRGGNFEAAKDTAAGQAFIVQSRHLGVMVICLSIAMFFVLFTAFNKGAQWAWWALLFGGGIAWLYGLIVQILEGDMLNMILHIIGIIILLFGLLLPVKEFFAKKTIPQT